MPVISKNSPIKKPVTMPPKRKTATAKSIEKAITPKKVVKKEEPVEEPKEEEPEEEIKEEEATQEETPEKMEAENEEGGEENGEGEDEVVELDAEEEGDDDIEEVAVEENGSEVKEEVKKEVEKEGDKKEKKVDEKKEGAEKKTTPRTKRPELTAEQKKNIASQKKLTNSIFFKNYKEDSKITRNHAKILIRSLKLEDLNEENIMDILGASDHIYMKFMKHEEEGLQGHAEIQMATASAAKDAATNFVSPRDTLTCKEMDNETFKAFRAEQVAMHETDKESEKFKDPKESRILVLGELEPEVTEEQLRSLLPEEEVVSILIAMDKDSKPKGYAYVELKSKDSVFKYITELRGKELEGGNKFVAARLGRYPNLDDTLKFIEKNTALINGTAGMSFKKVGLLQSIQEKVELCLKNTPVPRHAFTNLKRTLDRVKTTIAQTKAFKERNQQSPKTAPSPRGGAPGGKPQTGRPMATARGGMAARGQARSGARPTVTPKPLMKTTVSKPRTPVSNNNRGVMNSRFPPRNTGGPTANRQGAGGMNNRRGSMTQNTRGGRMNQPMNNRTSGNKFGGGNMGNRGMGGNMGGGFGGGMMGNNMGGNMGNNMGMGGGGMGGGYSNMAGSMGTGNYGGSSGFGGGSNLGSSNMGGSGYSGGYSSGMNAGMGGGIDSIRSTGLSGGGMSGGLEMDTWSGSRNADLGGQSSLGAAGLSRSPARYMEDLDRNDRYGDRDDRRVDTARDNFNPNQAANAVNLLVGLSSILRGGAGSTMDEYGTAQAGANWQAQETSNDDNYNQYYGLPDNRKRQNSDTGFRARGGMNTSLDTDMDYGKRRRSAPGGNNRGGMRQPQSGGYGGR